MIIKTLVFGSIFILGELTMNYTLFSYLKKYFGFNERMANQENKTNKPFLGINLSVFKGLLERFVIYICLVLGISQVLIVFGAIKIGTRFDKTKEVTNDYFLIGNFCSILIAVFYFFVYNKLLSVVGNYSR
ncbi:MAG: hypothetical protein IPK03_03890 [Bacteroidetes bacterium]|nr:hypothetical protein [Bacteroidota bacterium]